MAEKPEAEMTQEAAADAATEATPENPAVSPESAAGAVADPIADPLAEAEARAESFRDQYLRAAAELENQRKRAERDILQARKYALERFVAELLPVKDSLEMGIAAATDLGENGQALREGFDITLKQFQQVLEKFGVEETHPEGETFNPEFHEAMAMQPSAEVAPNTVLSVVQKGYLLNGRIVRPARVLVSRAVEE